MKAAPEIGYAYTIGKIAPAIGGYERQRVFVLALHPRTEEAYVVGAPGNHASGEWVSYAELLGTAGEGECAMSDRSRPIRREVLPVVGSAYYRDVVVDSPQKTWRCFVIAIDEERQVAFCVWDAFTDYKNYGIVDRLSWVPFGELRDAP